MPTYEFVCPNGHHFDKFFRKISDAPGDTPCPECGAEAERQISGGAGLVFKGSGFYITDYGKDGKKGAKSPSSSSGTESGAGKSSGEGASAGGAGGSASAPKSESGSVKADSGKKSE
jgi:putative FmdB family regulatory protein